jgi:hypothetical protein
MCSVCMCGIAQNGPEYNMSILVLNSASLCLNGAILWGILYGV